MNAIRNWFYEPMTDGEIAGSIMIAVLGLILVAMW